MPLGLVYSQFAFWKQSRSTFHRHPILNTAYDWWCSYFMRTTALLLSYELCWSYSQVFFLGWFKKWQHFTASKWFEIKKGRPGSSGCNYRPSVSPSLERNFFRCPPPLFRHWHLFIVLFSDAVSIKLRKYPATINDRCHLPYQNSSCDCSFQVHLGNVMADLFSKTVRVDSFYRLQKY